jgi:hypothetical protein
VLERGDLELDLDLDFADLIDFLFVLSVESFGSGCPRVVSYL